jgi:hypothetical protein
MKRAEPKYLLRYHSLETGRTEMAPFHRFFGMVWFLLVEGRPALLSGRYQILTIKRAS